MFLRYNNIYNPLAFKPLNKLPMWFKQMNCDSLGH
jgi:hypothetical protein